MRPILLEEFSFVHIPFGSIVKFQFLVLFPVNNLTQPDMSYLTLFLG